MNLSYNSLKPYVFSAQTDKGLFEFSSSFSVWVIMAEASRSFYSTLIPNFSQPISSIRKNSVSPTILRRNSICCSSISTTSNESTITSANQKIPWGCDVDSLENASLLQTWLSESGLPPQRMGIQRVDVGERGLVALKNIRKGEKLLFVPPSLVISADSVRFLKISILDS